MIDDTPRALQPEPEWSAEWELPWQEQTFLARAAQAVWMAHSFTTGEEWTGELVHARRYIDTVRELERLLLDGFAAGWRAEGDRFSVAALASQVQR